MPLSPPPVDEDDCPLPHDHEDIRYEDIIVKRVTEHHVTRDDEGNIRKLNSNLFSRSSSDRDKYRGSSIDILKLIEELGISVEEHIAETPKLIGYAFLQAGAVRDLGGKVGYQPLPENVAHGNIWEITSKKQMRDLARGVTFHQI